MTGKYIIDNYFKKGSLNFKDPKDDQPIYYIDIGLISKDQTESMYDSTRIIYFYESLDELKDDYNHFENSKEVQDAFLLEYAKVYKSENKNKFVEFIDLIN